MKYFGLLVALIAGVFVLILDIITSLGYAEWLLYIILLFLFITYTESKKHILILTSVYGTFLIIGYFLSPPAKYSYSVPILNRSLALIVLALFALIGAREKEAKKISSEILERIRALFIAIDKKMRIVFFNRAAKQLAGLDEDMIGKNIFDVFPILNKNEMLQTKIQTALDTKEPIHFEYALTYSDKFLDVSLYASDKGLSVIARDITERVIAEKKLVKLLHEKEVLMKEMHHRTKNNFQLVMSLLNLQINSIQDELSIKILNETRARLLSITLLYDKLFKSGDFYTIDMNTFISDIVTNMDTAANFGIITMENDLDIERAKIGIEAAIPLGLIINELYTNSLKYAFNGTRNDAVNVCMKFIDNENLYIKYSDRGKGLPDGFNLKESTGLGMTLITGFVEQLEGKIEYKNNNGAEFHINVKVKKLPESIDSSLLKVQSVN